MKTKYKIIIVLFASIVVIRELGLVNIYWCKNNMSSYCARSEITEPGSELDLTDIDISLWPSPLDYIPFYKVRTFEGEVNIGDVSAKSHKSSLKLKYKIEQSAFGICSGYQFRQNVKKEILKQLIK